MKVSIAGRPQTGKTTLWTALTGLAPAAAYGEANVGIVRVPDDRLVKLASVDGSGKTTFNGIEFADYPGLAAAEEKGKAELLGRMREADGTVLVLGAFGGRDPVSEYDDLLNDFLLGDLEILENRIERLSRGRGSREDKLRDRRELEILSAGRVLIEAGDGLDGLDISRDEKKLIAAYGFLTQKPAIPVVNVEIDEVGRRFPAPLDKAIVLCADIEKEVIELEAGERAEFLADLGVAEPARDALIGSVYRAFDLVTFYTGGPAEAKAHAIAKGSTAVEAADKVHSDMARGFVKAEVMRVDDVVGLGGVKEAKVKNLCRLEGKEYIVENGDLLVIRFTK